MFCKNEAISLVLSHFSRAGAKIFLPGGRRRLPQAVEVRRPPPPPRWRAGRRTARSVRPRLAPVTREIASFLQNVALSLVLSHFSHAGAKIFLPGGRRMLPQAVEVGGRSSTVNTVGFGRCGLVVSGPESSSLRSSQIRYIGYVGDARVRLACTHPKQPGLVWCTARQKRFKNS